MTLRSGVRSANRRLAEWVKEPSAIQWLLDLWDAYEVVDDLIDKDKPVSDEDIFRMLWRFSIDLPSNPFFLANHATLLPIVHMGIGCWIDSVKLEREGSDRSLRFSYVMRAAYIQTLNIAITLVRGREAMEACSMEIVEFFGSESWEEYAGKIRSKVS